jgi:hypothetical protein
MGGFEFVGLLGGSGFDPKFPRVAFAFKLAMDGKILVTSGLDPKDGVSERDFLADFFRKQLGRKSVLIGKGGDPIHRDSKDDIRQIFNAIGEYRLYDATITFPTEGRLHAFRIKIYAKMQLPSGVFAKIVCVDDGAPVGIMRQIHEVCAVLKLFGWMLYRCLK